MVKALVGARIFTGDGFLENHAVVIADGKIQQVIAEDLLDASIPKQLLKKNSVLAPGFIDVQVNGGGGFLFTDSPNAEGINALYKAHRSKGTTSVLPTLVSHSRETYLSAFDAVSEAIANGNCGILGVHVEGPFFNPARRGAHQLEYLKTPTQQDIDWLLQQANQFSFKWLVTLAPEKFQTGQISALAKAGISVCAGHTDAHYEQINNAIDEGLRGFTHLYNAMRPTTGREPGVVGAALSDEKTWCGIIVDGHHVHAANVKLAQKIKAKGKLFLVSDAMSTVGSDNKSFQLYDETILEKNGCLINSEGHLAGSAIGLIDAVKLSTTWVGLDLAESLRMASLYPAQFLKVDHYLGKIQSGYRADLVNFSEDYSVLSTWLAGEMVEHH